MSPQPERKKHSPTRQVFQVPLPSDFNSCESNNLPAAPKHEPAGTVWMCVIKRASKREERGWVWLPQLSLWCWVPGDGLGNASLRRQQGGHHSPACPAWWPTPGTAAATWKWMTLWSA